MKGVFAALAVLVTMMFAPAALAQTERSGCILDPAVTATQGGQAVATFRVAPECESVEVALTSYRAPAPTPVFPQSLFDSITKVFEAGETGSLSVKVPDCFFQVDLGTGPVVQDLTGWDFPGWVAASNGGTGECVETPAPAAPVLAAAPAAPPPSAPALQPDVAPAPSPEAAPAPEEAPDVLPERGAGSRVFASRVPGGGTPKAGGSTSTSKDVDKPDAVVVKGVRRSHVPQAVRKPGATRPSPRVVGQRVVSAPREAAAPPAGRAKTLPYTGLPLWALVLLGGTLIGIGLQLRRIGERMPVAVS